MTEATTILTRAETSALLMIGGGGWASRLALLCGSKKHKTQVIERFVDVFTTCSCSIEIEKFCVRRGVAVFSACLGRNPFQHGPHRFASAYTTV